MIYDIFGNQERRLRTLMDDLKKAPLTEEQTARIVDFFEPLIREKARKMAIRDEKYLQKLSQVILNELVEILENQLVIDNDFFVKNHKQLIDRLFELCLWKQQVVQLDVAEVARLENAPIGSVAAYLSPKPEATYAKKLWQNLNIDEQNEVEYRTLRAVLALAKAQRKTTIFALQRGQFVLNQKHLTLYSGEQIELYVYLFRNKERIRFLQEAVVEVARLLQNDLRRARGQTDDQTTLQAAAQDMAADIQESFLKKYDKHRSPPNYFYLDATMTTYLYAYAKTEHLVGKYGAEQAQKIEVDDTNFNEEIYNGSVFENDNDFLKQIIRKCLRDLEKSDSYCADIVKLRFWGNHGRKALSLTDVAEEMNKSEKAIRGKYEDCFPKLKQMVQQAILKRD